MTNTILALRVNVDGTSEPVLLPASIDFLTQVMEGLGTDQLNHIVVTEPGKGAGLDVWFDDYASIRPDPQPNHVASSLISQLGRTESLYGTVFFTGGLDKDGVVQGFQQATVHGLGAWVARLAAKLGYPGGFE
jgi:hypothetical protein